MSAKFTCLLLLMAFSNLYAQDYARMQLGVSYGQNLDQVVYMGKKRHLMNDLKEGEKPVFGSSFGVNLIYNLNDRAGLETGLLYARRGFEYEGYRSILRESYQTIDVPIRINYWLNRSRLSFVVGLGINLSLVANYKASYREDAITYEPIEIRYLHQNINNPIIPINQRSTINIAIDVAQNTLNRKINLIPSLSLGASYNISKNVAFRVETAVRYALLSSSKKGKFNSRVIDLSVVPTQSTQDDNFVSQNFWNVGINAGLYFTLKYD